MPWILSGIALFVVLVATAFFGFFAIPVVVVLLVVLLLVTGGARALLRAGPVPPSPHPPAETPGPTPGAARRES